MERPTTPLCQIQRNCYLHSRQWLYRALLARCLEWFFLQEKLPRLFTFAKDQKISVAAFLSTPDMSTLFHLPLSEQAYQEFQELQEIIQSVQMTQTDKDQWHYIWGSSKYTSKSFYNHLYKDFHPPKPFLWIWKSRCCNKLRVFSWLLLMDRLNTRSLLKRKKN